MRKRDELTRESLRELDVVEIKDCKGEKLTSANLEKKIKQMIINEVEEISKVGEIFTSDKIKVYRFSGLSRRRRFIIFLKNCKNQVPPETIILLFYRFIEGKITDETNNTEKCPPGLSITFHPLGQPNPPDVHVLYSVALDSIKMKMPVFYTGSKCKS